MCGTETFPDIDVSLSPSTWRCFSSCLYFSHISPPLPFMSRFHTQLQSRRLGLRSNTQRPREGLGPRSAPSRPSVHLSCKKHSPPGPA